MRFLTCAALVLIAAAPASAQTNADLMAPINKFIDSFNKGDAVAAAATHAASTDLTIVDEVPPYVWQGSNAFQSWSTDLGSDAKKNGITDASVKLSAPARIEKNADHAYVVVPAVYSFTQGGKVMHESAHMTFVLKKDAGASGWLIHAWTWTGPRPAASAASPKR